MQQHREMQQVLECAWSCVAGWTVPASSEARDGVFCVGQSQRQAWLIALPGQGLAASGHNDGFKFLPPLVDVFRDPFPGIHSMSPGCNCHGFTKPPRASIWLNHVPTASYQFPSQAQQEQGWKLQGWESTSGWDVVGSEHCRAPGMWPQPPPPPGKGHNLAAVDSLI